MRSLTGFIPHCPHCDAIATDMTSTLALHTEGTTLHVWRPDTPLSENEVDEIIAAISRLDDA